MWRFSERELLSVRWGPAIRERLSQIDPKRSFACSFDDFVGAGEHREWQNETQRLGGVEIDDQLELRRLPDRDIGRLGALQYFVYVSCGAPVHVREVRAVGHQASHLDKLPPVKHRREPSPDRQV